MLQLPTFLLALTAAALAAQDSSSTARAPSEGLVAAAWYAAWHSTDFPLAQVSWSKFTHMAYAFAVPSPDPAVITLGSPDEVLLPQFVTAARENDVHPLLSIGGWTGSRYFSTAVGSAQNRTAFVQAVMNLTETYDLDGVDFDWEYPNMQGMGCNEINANDTANFLLFLQELRAAPGGAALEVTAAVYVDPFNDAAGAPSADLSGFAAVFDWIVIMNYDTKTNAAVGAGSRSPLDDSCAPAGAKTGSAMSSVAAWHAAGIPLRQLVLGVPAHAHSYDVAPSVAVSRTNATQLTEYPAFAAERKVGDRWDGTGGEDACGVTWGPGGTFAYWGLIEEGFLHEDGSPRDGILHRYDDCSETPFVYNPDTRVLVTYENARSYAAKGDFIHTSGLGGFAMWEAGADRNDTLLDAILDAAANGKPEVRTDKSRFQTTVSAANAPARESGARPARSTRLLRALCAPLALALASVLAL